jgi:hypothetical protein
MAGPSSRSRSGQAGKPIRCNQRREPAARVAPRVRSMTPSSPSACQVFGRKALRTVLWLRVRSIPCPAMLQLALKLQAKRLIRSFRGVVLPEGHAPSFILGRLAQGRRRASRFAARFATDGGRGCLALVYGLLVGVDEAGVWAAIRAFFSPLAAAPIFIALARPALYYRRMEPRSI